MRRCSSRRTIDPKSEGSQIRGSWSRVSLPKKKALSELVYQIKKFKYLNIALALNTLSLTSRYKTVIEC